MSNFPERVTPEIKAPPNVEFGLTRGAESHTVFDLAAERSRRKDSTVAEVVKSPSASIASVLEGNFDFVPPKNPKLKTIIRPSEFVPTVAETDADKAKLQLTEKDAKRARLSISTDTADENSGHVISTGKDDDTGQAERHLVKLVEEARERTSNVVHVDFGPPDPDGVGALPIPQQGIIRAA